MANEQEVQQVQDQQSTNDKIGKAYDAGFKKLIALIQGKKQLFKKSKVANNDVATLVDELMEERKLAIAKEVKDDIRKLLEAKMEFNKLCKKAEEDYIKTTNDQKKAFTDKMSAIFAKIENINDVEKSFYTSM